MNKKRNNKGFSLVELIVVIAIMAVLVVVLAPTYLRYVEKSKVNRDVSAIGEVVNAYKIAGATTTIDGSTIVIDSDGDLTITEVASTGTPIATEVNATVGTNISLSSKALSAATITISSTSGKITVTPSGVSTDDPHGAATAISGLSD